MGPHSPKLGKAKYDLCTPSWKLKQRPRREGGGMCDTRRKGTYTEPSGDVLHGHYDNPYCRSSFEAKARIRLGRGERAFSWLLVGGSTEKDRQAF